MEGRIQRNTGAGAILLKLLPNRVPFLILLDQEKALE
jgi:hypothetical protein